MIKSLTKQMFVLCDNGTEGGTRTLMKLPSQDFESCASAIPPLRFKIDTTLIVYIISIILSIFFAFFTELV